LFSPHQLVGICHRLERLQSHQQTIKPAKRSFPFFERRFGEQWPSLQLALAEDERLAGFNQVRDGKLDMLFLHPDFFGRGFGAALLANAEERGATRLDCFMDNHPARRFYERHGWRLDGEFRQEFAGREFDSVVYRKP
jgi:putative acetyltransferase